MNKKIILGAVIGVALATVAGALCYTDYRRKEGMRFVQALGNGINIGNNLDATGVREHMSEASVEDYETFWNNPPIRQELFWAVKDAGFKSVRIPVTWDEHLDEEGTIEQAWLDRVQEVVDMALAEELYVILDTHHEMWLDLKPEREKEIGERLSRVWTQIAQCFRDYDEKLLFEGMNEPRLRDSEFEWTPGTKELQAMTNRLNRVFVDTVRSVGGENEDRYLLICPYANRYEAEALEAVQYIKGHIIVSVHAYIPYSFCDGDRENKRFDAEDQKDTEKIDTLFAWLEKNYVKKNIPVIITEFGSEDKGNREDRLEWLQYYLMRAQESGVTCFWWDEGDDRKLIDRESLVWKEQEMVEMLTRGKGRQ